MEAEKTDWTSFRKRIVIDKSLHDVYSAWATQAKMERWFLERASFFSTEDTIRKSDEFIRKGDKFTWKWNNWDFEEKGEILEENDKDSISFTFGKGGIVHVNLKEISSGTEVVLLQEDIPTDEKSKKDIFVGCATGWTFWPTNLKAWLEYGISLHAKGLSQVETKDLINS